MDLNETEDKNDCADEGQQQFNWPTEVVSAEQYSAASAVK
jgi:hypothetical protein